MINECAWEAVWPGEENQPDSSQKVFKTGIWPTGMEGLYIYMYIVITGDERLSDMDIPSPDNLGWEEEFYDMQCVQRENRKV